MKKSLKILSSKALSNRKCNKEGNNFSLKMLSQTRRFFHSMMMKMRKKQRKEGKVALLLLEMVELDYQKNRCLKNLGRKCQWRAKPKSPSRLLRYFPIMSKHQFYRLLHLIIFKLQMIQLLQATLNQFLSRNRKNSLEKSVLPKMILYQN